MNFTSLSIENRVRYCNCHFCLDSKLYLTCVEQQFYFLEYKPKEIDAIMKKIKRKIFRKRFLNYIKCLLVFDKLYKEIIEKRYRPYGNGYNEAKNHFNETIFYLKL